MKNQKKIRVAVLFGGKSAEHEVSLQSAKNVIEAIDKNKYEVVLIGIDKQGRWLLNDQSRYLLNADNPKLIALNSSNKGLAIIPGADYWQFIRHPLRRGEVIPGQAGNDNLKGIDVVFPVLHGTYGEDGTMQGLLKMLDIPFVGAGVLGSAVGMDKDVQKRLLRDAGIPTAKFLVFRRGEKNKYADAAGELGVPFFVKPANAGSSVGVSKVHNEKEFLPALKDAFQYDIKVLAEEYINGREIECSVLGNDDPIVSVPGEIIPQHEFYSYDAKYIDENGAVLKIPADLPREIVKKVQETALKTYQVLCCEGMARCDSFLTKDNRVVVNEINTIPGFTKISMYPKLWEASGISYTELIDRLIKLAIQRHEGEKKLRTAYT